MPEEVGWWPRTAILPQPRARTQTRGFKWLQGRANRTYNVGIIGPAETYPSTLNLGCYAPIANQWRLTPHAWTFISRR